jgi:glucose-1-phosphate thymidylyltransferase
VVTRPEKRDVVENAKRHAATVIEARPASLAASLGAGIAGLSDNDLVLFGFPDSIWEPADGYRRLVASVEAGFGVALGLFRASGVERPDVATLSDSGVVTEIDVDSDAPPPHLLWGCAAARAGALRGVRDYDDPGDYLSSLCRTSPIAGVLLSDSYIDIGTRRGLQEAISSQAGRR